MIRSSRTVSRRVMACGASALCAFALLGCSAPGPLLRPVSATILEFAPGVPIEVDAATAAPAWSVDELRLLSRVYAALWVRVRNETTERVALNPNGAVLFDAAGTPWLGLNETQRTAVGRWRARPWRSSVHEWMFRGRYAALFSRLPSSLLDDAGLAPGEAREGFLLFKPISSSACRVAFAAGSSGSSLELEWRAAPLEQVKDGLFQVGLQCADYD